MLNKVILIGNLTREIELRYTPTGTAIAKTSLAVNRRFKGQNGEQKDETMFIDLTIFGRSAEIANQYLGKGSKILVEGRLVLEQWTDQNGQNRSKHSIAVENLQFLDSKDQASNNSYDNSGYASAPSYNQGHDNASYDTSSSTRPTAQKNYAVPMIDMNDDDIPF